MTYTSMTLFDVDSIRIEEKPSVLDGAAGKYCAELLVHTKDGLTLSMHLHTDNPDLKPTFFAQNYGGKKEEVAS